MEKDKQLNFIYSKLVKDDLDLAGIVAYHYYKKHKIEWCQEFKKKNKRDATNDELKTFHQTFTPESILSLKSKADKTLEIFANTIKTISLDEVKRTIETANNKENTFWSNVWVNLFSSFLYSIALALITFIVWSLDHDFITELIKYVTKL